MMKKLLSTMLLALVTMTGVMAQVRCHIQGTLETDEWGDEIIICEDGTDLRMVDDPRFHVKAKDGKFVNDVETDYPKRYVVFFLKQYETGNLNIGKFLAENCNVNVTMCKDKQIRIDSNGNEYPILLKLYSVLDAIHTLTHASVYADFDPSPWESYLTLYHDSLINSCPDHPVHKQIAAAETAYRLQPGKPYIDYTVRDADNQLVPISSLMKNKVVLLDLWASWCGPCRRHSIDMIPVYERYKDKGFTVIAIARERNREAMEKAAKKDGYPWVSLLELNDENQVWQKNGVGNGGGAMFLIGRDGTILSTSTDVGQLEPIIMKALNNN